ncbi:MAG: peptidoglycan binding domain-containing protein, partial [Chloroflexota bacterium]|nr:peptidoglycan binding domain-containing protein [Chloroflexota bacterium]
MVQRTSVPQSSIATPVPIGRAADQLREWYGVAAGRTRRAVLPDHDQSGGAEQRPRETASPGRTSSQRLMVLLPRVLAGVAALLFLLTLGLFAFRALFNDRIYPSIVVGDVPVGGLTAQQAGDRISDRAAELERGTVTFSYGGKTWTPTLSELGATVEGERSIQQALALGRSDDAASRFAFTGDILRGDQSVALRSRVDQSVLDRWFDRVDSDLGQPAVNAQIAVNGTDVSISPDATGIVVDREAAIDIILGSLTELEPVRGELPTVVDQPVIRVADLEAVQSDVQKALSRPVPVRFEDQTWNIEA